MTSSHATTVVPGGGTAVVGSHLVALLDAGPGDPVVRELWDAVRSGATLADALTLLGRRGFHDLPDLALSGSVEGVRRLVVRGDVEARVIGPAGESVDLQVAGGVLTWVEHPVPTDAALHLRLATAGPALGAGYELERGLAPAAAIDLTPRPTTAAPRAAPPPVPAPAPPPAPPEPGPLASADRPSDHTQPVGPPPPPPAPGPPHRSADRAAVVAPSTPPPPSTAPIVPTAPAAEAAGDADHDGRTISVRDLLRRRGAAPVTARTDVTPTTPTHLATRCPDGHLNPVPAERCRACGAPVPDQVPEPVSTLDLGRFRFSTGAEVAVLRPMLIGRAPQVNGQVHGEVPELVAVPSPEQDISRTHVEVRLEGWQVLVIDRGSTNGTVVTTPGREPRRLRPDQPFPLPVGGRVSMAGEVDFTLVVPA